MNKDFNVAGNQPVYCMFFPYKAEFKSRLEAVMNNERAVNSLLGGAMQDIVSLLENIAKTPGSDAQVYPPQFTDDGMYMGGSELVLRAFKAHALKAFDMPRETTPDEAVQYVADQEEQIAGMKRDDSGSPGPVLN